MNSTNIRSHDYVTEMAYPEKIRKRGVEWKNTDIFVDDEIRRSCDRQNTKMSITGP